MATMRVPAEFADWPADLPYSFGPYRAVCKHHVDGDTADYLLDAGLRLYPYLTIRTLGVDTPETNRAATKAAGDAATDYVKRLVPVGARVLLHTRPDPDSFGRWLARITLPGGFDLAGLIINAGHGIPA